MLPFRVNPSENLGIVRIILLFGLAALVAGPALADFNADMQKCRAVENSAERLSCYDALNRPASVTAAQPAGTGAARPVTESVAPAVVATPVSAPASSMPAAVTTTPVAVVSASGQPEIAPASGGTATTSTQDADADLFGFENRKFIEGMQQIESRYVGEFRGWSGKTLFRLENGQVWQQAETSRLVWRSESPMITIKKAVFGSFRLKVEGVNKSVRVKRVK